ncbi:MAG: MFS transporter [Verrucomicrobia bacterium]|nr:MFS transporter [Verrucomicrobiota bacterium]
MEHDNELPAKTRRALLWMNLSHEPFVVLYALLPFILRKDLGASILQISILTSLRPILPVFSFYWSANLTNRKNRLRSNLIGAWALARLPFLAVPWVENVWYLIFCCAVYELFNKSGIPALIEILKINIPKESREKTFTLYFVLTFIESIVLGLLMAKFLDRYSWAWQMLCGSAALLGLSSIYLQMKVPIPEGEGLAEPKLSWKEKVVQPWHEAWRLLGTRSDFARFQWGFMMGGFGLMLIAPSLSIFYVDRLDLSHANVVTGRSILMGLGIVASSYFWKGMLARENVDRMTKWILAGFALYPLALVLAEIHMGWFYLSFILYGIAQAGSHLLWNLSGTLFAQEEDSSSFSRVNILMVGLRGLVAPALGGILCKWVGPVWVFLGGSAICFGGVLYTVVDKFKYKFELR